MALFYIVVFSLLIVVSGVDLKNKENHGRLMKDNDPLAAAGEFNEEPIVADRIESDTLGRVVKKNGPITRKIVASGSPPGDDDSDFSLHAWKFAGRDGTVHGVIEETLGSSGKVTKVGIDCLYERDDGTAIIGGIITNSPQSRAYVMVAEGKGDDTAGKISKLVSGLSEDTSCSTFNVEKFDAASMYAGLVRVCNKHNGELEWTQCTEGAHTSTMFYKGEL